MKSVAFYVAVSIHNLCLIGGAAYLIVCHGWSTWWIVAAIAFCDQVKRRTEG